MTIKGWRLECLQGTTNTAHCSEHHGRASVKCELLQSSRAPMCLPDITVHDQTCQAFLFYICMLQVIKTGGGEA